jgi:ferric-dicitrate binding protein FerR (iron transport regulator)
VAGEVLVVVHPVRHSLWPGALRTRSAGRRCNLRPPGRALAISDSPADRRRWRHGRLLVRERRLEAIRRNGGPLDYFAARRSVHPSRCTRPRSLDLVRTETQRLEVAVRHQAHPWQVEHTSL